MECKFEDIKNYLIKNGERKETGVAQNRVVVYTGGLGGVCKLYRYALDGYSVWMQSNAITPQLRYNETRGTIQIIHWIGFYSRSRWTDLKFDENGCLKNKNYTEKFFTSIEEAIEYKKLYLKEHKKDVEKCLHSYIKTAKSTIKRCENYIKKYENELKNIERL